MNNGKSNYGWYVKTALKQFRNKYVVTNIDKKSWNTYFLQTYTQSLLFSISSEEETWSLTGIQYRAFLDIFFLFLSKVFFHTVL